MKRVQYRVYSKRASTSRVLLPLDRYKGYKGQIIIEAIQYTLGLNPPPNSLTLTSPTPESILGFPSDIVHFDLRFIEGGNPVTFNLNKLNNYSVNHSMNVLDIPVIQLLDTSGFIIDGVEYEIETMGYSDAILSPFIEGNNQGNKLTVWFNNVEGIIL